MSLPESPSPVPLPNAQTGGVFRVVRVDADGVDADRLKALGVCLGRRLSLVQAGDPLIVFVVGTRVGISSRLAETVFVELECLPQRANLQ
ncbi:FeoA family protein [Aeoliella mucimassa]|uniref:FeoA family protein n=1 Tax=Aeoliella mucimassa TaxID=2527972 RepID=UPI0018D31422|nr:FeoA family protein [Aeoliella mucimassa]